LVVKHAQLRGIVVEGRRFSYLNSHRPIAEEADDSGEGFETCHQLAIKTRLF
jgi:hypothetical protein